MISRRNGTSVGETGVGKMGVGKMGQIKGETGVGEMGQIMGETGVGEMGVGKMGVILLRDHKAVQCDNCEMWVHNGCSV